MVFFKNSKKITGMGYEEQWGNRGWGVWVVHTARRARSRKVL